MIGSLVLIGGMGALLYQGFKQSRKADGAKHPDANESIRYPVNLALPPAGDDAGINPFHAMSFTPGRKTPQELAQAHATDIIQRRVKAMARLTSPPDTILPSLTQRTRLFPGST